MINEFTQADIDAIIEKSAFNDMQLKVFEELRQCRLNDTGIMLKYHIPHSVYYGTKFKKGVKRIVLDKINKSIGK